MKNRLTFVFISLFLAFSSVQAERIKVAVTHPFYIEWVEQLGGEEVEVYLVSEYNASQLRDTEIVYETGLGEDSWLDAAIERRGATPRRVVLTDGIPTMTKGEAYWSKMPLPHPNPDKMPSCCQEDAKDTNLAWESLVEKASTLPISENQETDLNVWFNPNYAQNAILVISDTLVEALPEATDRIDRNTVEALDGLQELDGWIKSRIRDIPMSQRLLSTEGDSFRYYAKQYGLLEVDHLDEGVTLEEAYTVCACDPCGCDECGCSTKSMTLYKEPSPYGHPSAPGDYNAVMRYNTDTIVKALSAEPQG